MPFAWRCPFCGHHATIGTENYSVNEGTFVDGSKYGTQQVKWTAISCPNPKCREYAFSLTIHDYGVPKGATSSGTLKAHSLRYQWQLVPAAEMLVLPDYLPAQYSRTTGKHASSRTCRPRHPPHSRAVAFRG